MLITMVYDIPENMMVCLADGLIMLIPAGQKQGKKHSAIMLIIYQITADMRLHL
ncbi:hypothetical protein SDC9_52970 [bioreactor metagenome]|uniref:Uncharacterized protein n=1 Tax=bioreactor metagenome TaxID=1076179 RepID=A0A644WT80_9ZZZZ